VFALRLFWPLIRQTHLERLLHQSSSN
jgi:hypothetical protein